MSTWRDRDDVPGRKQEPVTPAEVLAWAVVLELTLALVLGVQLELRWLIRVLF